MLHENLQVDRVADRFLQELRFGRDRAESTTKAYAGGVALFLRWCNRTGRDWRAAGVDLGLFITWLKYSSADGSAVVPGPGSRPVARTPTGTPRTPATPRQPRTSGTPRDPGPRQGVTLRHRHARPATHQGPSGTRTRSNSRHL